MILVDTGPLVAAGDLDARIHDVCVEALRRARPPRLVPGPVIAEVCYLLAREVGASAEAAFLRSFRTGFLTPADLGPADLERAAELVERYADLPLGGTDACVVALAERHGVTDVATIDVTHFRVVRPRHVTAFPSCQNSCRRTAAAPVRRPARLRRDARIALKRCLPRVGDQRQPLRRARPDGAE